MPNNLLLLGCGSSGGGGISPDVSFLVTFSPAPATGTWTMDVGGDTTGTMAVNVDAATLESELESATGLAVTVTGSVGSGFTCTFPPGTPTPTVDDDDLATTVLAATINVVRATPGVAAVAGQPEIQTLTVDADGGDFFLNSTQVQYNNTSLVESTIESTTASSVTVTGTIPGTVTITWDSNGPQADLSVSNFTLTLGEGSGSVSTSTSQNGISAVAGTAEVQTITLADNPDTGTWSTIPFSSTIDWDGTAAEVEAAIESALSQGVTVTGSDGGAYTSTWDDVGPRSALGTNGGGLRRTVGVTATVTPQ